MSGFDKAQQMIEELALHLEPDALLAFPQERTWSALVLGARLELALDDDDEILVIAVDIGVVPEEASRAAHEMLLRLGFLWRESGGLSAMLDEEGNAALVLRQRLATLDTVKLARLVENLAVYAESWANLMDELAVSPDTGDGDGPMLPPLGSILV